MYVDLDYSRHWLPTRYFIFVYTFNVIYAICVWTIPSNRYFAPKSLILISFGLVRPFEMDEKMNKKCVTNCMFNFMDDCRCFKFDFSRRFRIFRCWSSSILRWLATVKRRCDPLANR